MTAAESRPRNAAATREAILRSAIRHFARAGYDGVGVRAIAHDAGVSAMMVNRYFGSKERLFAEAVEVSFAPPAVVGADPASLAQDTAAALVARTDPGADPLDPFLIMLRSVSSPYAAQIVRDAIARHVGQRVARQLPESDNGIRTEVMLSVISGVLLMRRVVGTRALNEAPADRLAAILESVFAAIADAAAR
ncbi:TetR family transcriptional regulator [Nocardia sp. NPDC050193]